jgi:hypothetical protein
MSEKDRTPDEALSPAVDPVRWEAAVRSIVAAAAPELERRARASSPVIVLARWTRPVLSAAAVVALLASAAILSRGQSDGEIGGVATAAEVAPEMAVASALLPGAMSTWIMGGETESVVALVQALEEGR